MPNHDAARILTDWKRRSGLTDEECARWCRIAVSTFRRQRKGKSRRADQTVALAELHQLVSVGWLDVAEAATKAARLLTYRP